MVTVTILYPSEPGKHFDIDYYRDKHIAMVRETLGEGLKGVSVERGLGGVEPDSPATYLVISRLYFDSMEDCVALMGPNDATFAADVPNFTDTIPVLQIGEVIV